MDNHIFRTWSTRAGAIAAVVFLAATTSVLATATPAQADVPACNAWSHDHNGPGEGYVIDDVNLKVAPYAHCGNVKLAHTGTGVYFHCYVYNTYGNEWVWVRISGTSYEGWVYREDLRILNNGWIEPCY